MSWQAWLFLVWLCVVGVLMLRPRPGSTIKEYAKVFCSNVGDAAFPGMQQEVDPRWIRVDGDEDGYVTDRRTGFRGSMDKILNLAKCCETEATHLEGGIVVERLCDVVFLVSPDWKIRAIMSEKTWKEKGQEILREIRGELGDLSVPVSPAKTPSGALRETKPTNEPPGSPK